MSTLPEQLVKLVKTIKADIADVRNISGLVGPRYAVEIESTNGDVFRPGQALTTTLIAHVFLNGAEVTNSIPESRFRWRRNSYYARPYPNDDVTWNAYYLAGYKTIEITTNSVESRATFHCDIQN